MCERVLHGTQAVLDVHVTTDGAVTHLGRRTVWTSLDPRPCPPALHHYQTPEIWIPILRGWVLQHCRAWGLGSDHSQVHGARSHALVARFHLTLEWTVTTAAMHTCRHWSSKAGLIQSKPVGFCLATSQRCLGTGGRPGDPADTLHSSIVPLAHI